MGPRMPMLCTSGPCLAAQQLNDHLITGIEPLNFYRHIDEAIRLDHRRQNTGALISGRSNLENPFLSGKNAAQKMPPIAPLGKAFLKYGLNHRTSIASTPAHFE